MPQRLDFIQRANAAYIEQQYQRYRQDPTSVPEDWALFFAGFDLAENPARAPQVAQPSGGIFALVHAYREFGHLAASLDPLGDSPQDHPLLDPATYGLTGADLDRPLDVQPFRGVTGVGGAQRGTLRELIAVLRKTYCGTLGVEYMDIPDPQRREWLAERIEAGHNRPTLSAPQRLSILEQLLTADAFEHFLHVKYVGQKRFSLEGAASLIPMLDTLLARAGSLGVQQIVIGMPHRGRINVLANVMNKPLEMIFSEFESNFAPEDVQGHGDVKYHLGYSSTYQTQAGHPVHLDLNFNPSHLEFVNPVVLGSMRARQDLMRDLERDRGIPLLIHGDAAFSGEGIVPETLALAQLPAYQTGGTVHVIVNNQIGFTISPADARVSRYCTDIARVIEAPVFHVNGDDPEACVHAITLALEYRMTFKRDAFVDLVCYRRYGHNELDDPTFTQPVMYAKIAAHEPASRRYAARLRSEGVIDEARLATLEASIQEKLNAAHARAREEPPKSAEEPLGGAWNGLEWAGEDWDADTGVTRETLGRIVQASARVPESFHPHPKVAKLYETRVQMVESDRIDWGCGEALAIGSLLLEGRGVRLTGQDTGRGTFSHRHAVLHDTANGARYVPLQHLATDQGTFQIIDTMLSEAAVLGFEYGYSTADPRPLVIWEAQFGDFANVAQVYIDQFLASAESKWRRMSGLTLLLPHGYEGQGPEHSSARLERFLELCANGNMQVVNPTTPAQLFHALRRQVRRKFRKPLVVMSPKSLLRHRLVISSRAEFTDGRFQTVIDDASVVERHAVDRVLLVSGKFYFTLLEARAAQKGEAGVALVRFEQLYPFPNQELAAVLARYPQARDVRWVQEEPANMGAWRQLNHRILEVLPAGTTLTRVSRKAAPTPATGYYTLHIEQERELIEKAFRAAAAPARIANPAANAPGGGSR